MITAKFGDKQFKVTSKLIYTPSDISLSESIELEETERSGNKPTPKVKSIKLKTLSFTVVLDARFVTVSTEFNWWQKTLRTKSSKDFYLGKHKLGKFYLTQVDAAEIDINKKGDYSKIKLNLSFTEDTVKSTTSSSGSSQTSSSSKTTNKFGNYGTGVKISAPTGSLGNTVIASSANTIKVGNIVELLVGGSFYSTQSNAIIKSSRGVVNKATKSNQYRGTVKEIYNKSGNIIIYKLSSVGTVYARSDEVRYWGEGATTNPDYSRL